MRSRDRILANLEAIYRESYDRAKAADEAARMIDLESAYMRDQLMLEILLDIRDLFAVAPAASGGSAIERLDQLRRLVRK
jgi:dihydroxyacetone kinase DhaKLM complex PTS-EIIA-like component DhaM